MSDLRQLRVRVPESLVQQAKQAVGDPDMSDTMAVRYAFALMAGAEPAAWAFHHRPGPKVKQQNDVTPAA